MNVAEIPVDWKLLIQTADALANADDATDAVTIELLTADTPYQVVLSRHQAWKNKYARAASRGLITLPYRIRRFKRGDGGYTIEAVADLDHMVEAAMVLWPGEDEPT